MKITQFDAPGSNGDFTGNAALAAKWSAAMSLNFDGAVGDVMKNLAGSGGTPQFYNPLTHGLSAPDVTPASAGDITFEWVSAAISGYYTRSPCALCGSRTGPYPRACPQPG